MWLNFPFTAVFVLLFFSKSPKRDGKKTVLNMGLITGLNKFYNQSENECSSEPKEGRVDRNALPEKKWTIPMIVLKFRTPVMSS